MKYAKSRETQHDYEERNAVRKRNEIRIVDDGEVGQLEKVRR